MKTRSDSGVPHVPGCCMMQNACDWTYVVVYKRAQLLCCFEILVTGWGLELTRCLQVCRLWATCPVVVQSWGVLHRGHAQRAAESPSAGIAAGLSRAWSFPARVPIDMQQIWSRLRPCTTVSWRLAVRLRDL